MKKGLLLILGIVIGIIFVFSVVIGITVYLYIDILKYESICILFVVIIALLFLLEFLNRKYDKSEGYADPKKVISRWSKNVIFISLIVGFLYACIDLLSKNTLNTNQEYMYYILFLFVVWAIVMYIQNYKSLLTRKTRIHALKNKNVIYKNRRYTFFVEEVKDVESQLYLTGILSGYMKVHDEVYVYTSKEEMFTTCILSINEDGHTVKRSKDKQVTITIKKNQKTELIKKYSVLSDIKENETKFNENNIEHPYLRGLITGYEKYHDDHEYMTLLLWKLAFSDFLLCAKATTDHDGNIMDTLKGNTNAAFPSVSTSFDTNLFILPIFTDWQALENWKLLMNEQDAVTLINEYHEVVDIMKKGFQGIVINPFGPQPFFMPEILANSIQTMYMESQKENS